MNKLLTNPNYKYQSLDGNNQEGGYAQYNPYGGSSPYADQSTSYNGANAVEQGNGGYEMAANPSGGPTAILNQCRQINDAIGELKAKREGQLLAAQNALLDSSTAKEDQTTRQTLDYIEDELNTGFRGLRDSLRKVKQTPGSGDSRVQPQIEMASKNLRAEISQYQKAQSDFQNRLKEQVRRRYMVANPEATPEELESGVESVLAGQMQAFQVTGARTRQANDAKQAAMERSEAIRKIERDMIELSRMYQEVAELVQQQEAPVEQISEDAEQAKTHIQDANVNLSKAVKSAINARKWKWYALIICLLIIGIVVGVAVGVTQGRK